jgi:hypothetical protein
VIRVLAFLLLVALASCSSAEAISVQATAVGDRAATIRGLAERIGAQSNQAEVVTDAAEISLQAQSIQHSVGVIHQKVTGVRDITPWWATLLQWVMIAAAGAALVWLFTATGLASACRVALGWIPRRKVSEAEMAAATMATDKPETIREWIAMKRASDKEFDAAWRKTQQEQTP